MVASSEGGLWVVVGVVGFFYFVFLYIYFNIFLFFIFIYC